VIRAIVMARCDFRTPRLYVEQPLERDASITLDRQQAHYLVNVLRLVPGATVLAFNGRDGEWRSGLAIEGRKRFALSVHEQTRPQPASGDLDYLFAPLKHARLDYMVQKAVEMGATRLMAVVSRHTQPQRVNLERMRANAIEAAEQCGILAIPTIVAPLALDRVIAEWPSQRLLVFCDEGAARGDSLARLAAARAAKPPAVAVLIGPEGGFADEERAALLRLPNVVRLSLGPRILRADTAAVAALALVQATLGDWT
jgi:16S rRNA (uracil1498-N3)-methyltransferase